MAACLAAYIVSALKSHAGCRLSCPNPATLDVHLCDIREQIQEVMESYKVELDGKT